MFTTWYESFQLVLLLQLSSFAAECVFSYSFSSKQESDWKPIATYSSKCNVAGKYYELFSRCQYWFLQNNLGIIDSLLGTVFEIK